jgi:thioredoxin-related protein
LIRSKVKKDLKEVERYKRIIISLDFLEIEIEKYKPVGDK